MANIAKRPDGPARDSSGSRVVMSSLLDVGKLDVTPAGAHVGVQLSASRVRAAHVALSQMLKLSVRTRRRAARRCAAQGPIVT